MAKRTPSRPSGAEDFLKVAKSARFASAWKKNRSQSDDNFESIELPEGQYRMQVVSVTPGVTKDSVPYINMRLVVTEGEYKDGNIALFFSLDPDRQAWLARALHRMGYDLEGEDIEIEDLVTIAKQLTEEKPHVMVSCKHRDVEVTDEKTKKKITRSVCNYYINKALQ